MPLLPKVGAAAVLLSLLAAGCVSEPEAPAATGDPLPDAAPLTIRDVQALVHQAGDNLSGRPAPGIVAVNLSIGHDAGEPTMGVTKEGVLFYAAITFDNDVAGQAVPLPRTDILRSKDGGATWEDVTPYLPGDVVRTHPDSGDPYVYVDWDTGRVFDIDQRLGVTCHTVTYSDDLGETWSPDSKTCLTPPADHQTLATGKPRVLPTAGYPNVVYYCNNQIATSTCMRSLDGGIVFEPTAPAFLGVEPRADPEDPYSGVCGGLHGHLAPAPDGTMYLPKTHCGVAYVSVTQDDGLTWTPTKVSDLPSFDDPAMAVDANGTAYIVFLHAETFHLYLSSSSDQGRTWSPPVDVTPPGVTATNLPTLAAGDDGRLALAYVGTTNPDGHGFAEKDEDAVTWDGYLSLITGAATAAPEVRTVRVNDPADPLVRGACGPGRCPGLYDFIDVIVDADGRPWVALVDACIESCAAPDGKAADSRSRFGFVATLAEGPSLRAGVETLPPIHGATAG